MRRRAIKPSNRGRGCCRRVTPAIDSLELRLLLSNSPLTAVPSLNSNPGATATLYLDFVGAPAMTWKTYSVPATPAYDIDGDPTTFSSTELSNIVQIWNRVSEAYSPFNINVTTIDPDPTNHNYGSYHAIRDIIGGDGSWYGGGEAGTSQEDAFANPLPKTIFSFSSALAGNTQEVADNIEHEMGHTLGLDHQSTYNSSGGLLAAYNAGTSAAGPIMGLPFSSTRAMWWYGPTPNGSTYMQDDLSVIASAINGFGYRSDPIGQTIGSAAPMTLSGTSASATGIVEQTTDGNGNIAGSTHDTYSFTTGAGSITLNVNVAQYGPTLHAQEWLYNSSGQLIASADSASTLGQTITTTVAAGTYYLVVGSYGGYGDVGQYTVSGNIVSPSAPSIAISGASSVNEQATYTLSLGATDPGHTISSWLVNWGDGNSQTVSGNPSAITHNYASGPNTYTITATATDDVGTYSAGNNVVVSVAHVAPLLAISGVAAAVERSPYTLSLSGSEPATGHTISGWSINWGDGNIQSVSGNPSSVTHTYALGPNAYTISAQATDDVGTYSCGNTVSVAVGHVAPTLSISGSSTSAEGTSYTLNLAASDPGHTIYSWTINWGDGSPQTVSGSPSTVTHTYALGPHTYSITASATDDAGVYSAPSSVSVNVTHVPPTVSTTGNASVAENSLYTLHLSAVEAVPGHTISGWTITWGDGLTQTVTGNLSSVGHIYTAVGTFTITASATDDVGSYGATPLFVSATKISPTLSISGSTTTNLGTAYFLALSGVEYDSDVITGWSINWGDGNQQTVAGSPSTVSHVFTTAGTYSISATATDAHGTYSANTLSVQANNTLPVANAGGPYSVYEGSTVALSSTLSTGTGLSFVWDLNGDGIYGQTGSAATNGDETGSSPVFSAGNLGPGTHPISLKITDGSGQVSIATATVTVLYAPPTISATGASSVTEGALYTLNIAPTSLPGTDAISSFVIVWGDGSTTTTAASGAISHVYNTAGTQNVIVDFSDDHGMHLSAANLSVAVQHAAPAVTISGAASSTNSPYVLQLSGAETGSEAITGWSIDWGDGTTQTISGNPSSVDHTFAFSATPRTVTASASDAFGSYASSTEITVISDLLVATVIGTPTIGSADSTFTLNFTNPSGINLGAIEATPVMVTGPNGYNQLATTGSVMSSSGTTASITYAVGSPSSTWTANDDGTYSVSMPLNGSTQTIADFAVNLPRADQAGNTLKTARNLGTITVGASLRATDWVGPTDTLDFYRIQITRKSGLMISTGALDDALQIQLLSGTGKVIGGVIAASGSSASYHAIVAAGTYFLKVASAGSVGTNYDLTIADYLVPTDAAGNTRSTARNLRIIGPRSAIAISGSVNPFDTADYFHFSIAANTHLAVKLSGLTAGITARLLNQAGQSVGSLQIDNTGAATFSRPLGVGSYYLTIESDGVTWADYHASLTGTALANTNPKTPFSQRVLRSLARQ